jgi:flavin reductase (DIM6/NTAB) family NADH-FMN oxidoreductase RutF
MLTDIDPATFRHVLGHLPTGVTIVTAHGAEGPVGMACNSFTSVSLAPPLVSFCPALTSTTWPSIRDAGRFCVNVLGGHHEDICRTFALRGVDRFAQGGWHERSGGPGLDDAAAWIDCDIQALHDAGDHVIVVGRVLALEAAERQAPPLVFHRGVYGSFVRSTDEGEHR